MARVLFTFLQPASFVSDDERLLAEVAEVRSFWFGVTAQPLRMVLRWVQQWWWLRRELPQATAIVGWFADYHMVLPVFLARRRHLPVLVMVGGFDAHHLPELNYGVFSGWRAPLARYVLRNASVLIPVTSKLIVSENTWSRYPEKRRDGLWVNVPGLNARIVPLHTGYREEDWPTVEADRAPSVVTVGYIESERSLKVKGIDILFEAARLLPDIPFTVIGVPEKARGWIESTYQPPLNVDLLPPRPRNELPQVYAGASVYAQLSRTEGLPNVVCEAMLCGCIPVGSPVSGIPEAIGPVGIVLESPEPERVAAGIRLALGSATPRQRSAARMFILLHFSMEQRKAKLHGLLQKLNEKARS